MHRSVALASDTPLSNFDALFAPDTAMPAIAAAFNPSTSFFAPSMPVCADARMAVWAYACLAVREEAVR